jgi:uncharacterized protein
MSPIRGLTPVSRSQRRAARGLVAAAVAAVALLVGAAPAGAHVEFEPSAAAPGSIVTLTLHLANERDDAGTTAVDLRFPDGQPLVVAELPPTPTWTATVQGGALGEPATGITWQRDPAAASPADDPVLNLRLGPLPAASTRLQFRLLQTYANGEVDRWIEDAPAGGAEPEMPGPVLDLQPGAAGDVPPPTTAAPTTVSEAPTTRATTTTAAPTTTTTSRDGTAAADEDGGDDGNPAGIVIAVVAAVVVGLGAAGAIAVRRRSRPA